jgi:hypothetical protein
MPTIYMYVCMYACMYVGSESAVDRRGGCAFEGKVEQRGDGHARASRHRVMRDQIGQMWTVDLLYLHCAFISSFLLNLPIIKCFTVK